ncbi:lysozyme inhibitor LprI family protein [Shewanella colwelliana]|uniref:lysozyme inhibitor LprI family protein n=1 Tax=Shewanella colwelliana TaxID=23 RepID=UPI0039C865D4
MKLLLLLLLFPVICSAGDYVWKSDCDRDMRSMKNCTGEMFRFYDSELNRLYTIQMGHLKTEYRKEYLREAQKAWVKFRDKDCMYYVGKREDSGKRSINQ